LDGDTHEVEYTTYRVLSFPVEWGMPRAIPTTTSVKFKKLKPDAVLPKAMTEGAAGMDLYAYLPDRMIHLEPGEWKLIPCGFAMAMEPGFEAQVRPRSGLAAKKGISVLNAPGTIDADYRGEVKVILINHSGQRASIAHKDRIAQMVINTLPHVRVSEVETLDDTERGTGGFGSTGAS
jgi:dUTP pyrophosphatase